MEKEQYTYSFDAEGVQKIYRNEAIMVVGVEWKINRAERKIDAGATRVEIPGFDSVFVQKS